MRNFFFALIFGFVSQLVSGQNVTSEKSGIKYYDHDFFLIEGTTLTDSEKENLYDRLPSSYKGKVRDAVWSLSKSSAGISVRFLSNSTTIRVKWELLNDAKMNHMAETGIKGIDLYFRNNGKWQYLNTARPAGKVNDYLLISNMDPVMREYRLYLPLYDGVTELEIGIDSLSSILKPERTNNKPIVFYGTSITQGGCASRPGMVHTSIISRKLDVECINFGFSGNGRMEKPLAELISGIDALFYVLDGTNNMTPEQIHENAIPLVEIIREKHPGTQIVFVEGLLNDKSYLDQKTRDAENAKNIALKKEFDEMKNRGFRNIYYIEQSGGKGTDSESTVDGVHLTDLGFSRYADFLLKEFRRIKVIDRKMGR
ncbi:MAG TPA: SGNH/GDSL hydrolase family protein [Bacteroidales bacterium]|nr:SGNH/GDSL hydrolase family protein [Bacteroidales bacterium]HQM68130.1 SGNH/GDSL hydrolase family protein [Bacteroidales bacterium]